MSLFTMPDGSSGDDGSGLSAYGGDSGSSDLSTLYGVSGGSVGDGYGFATVTDSTPVSASSNTLGQLQAGGSTIDWNSILQGGLTALVAADSISHGLTANGQALPTYRAPNGNVYPVGQGPGYVGTSGGGGFMMLLIIGVVLFAIAEDK